MKKGLRLTTIGLKTKAGTKVELTIEEAKELHAQLNELFGKELQYVPSRPTIIERDRYPSPPPWSTYNGVTLTGSPPVIYGQESISNTITTAPSNYPHTYEEI